MKDAWKSAVSFLRSPQNETKNETKEEIKTFEIDLSPFAAYSEAYGTLALTHTKEERSDAETAIRLGVNTVRTSSMGRLFDAVCAMLSIHDENRYEGECAILLENEARRALTKRLSGEAETERETLAIAFHEGVASAILEQCRHAREERGICKICLSGGVFQNRILMEETLRLLRGNGFEVYYNIHVPPNDGGIALGQIFIGMAVIEKKSE